MPSCLHDALSLISSSSSLRRRRLVTAAYTALEDGMGDTLLLVWLSSVSCPVLRRINDDLFLVDVGVDDNNV